MNELKILFQNVSMVDFLIICAALAYVIKIAVYGYKQITTYHDREKEKGEILETVLILKDDLDNLQSEFDNFREQQNENQVFETVLTLKDDLGDLKNEFDDFRDASIVYRRTSLHDKIYKMYNKFKEQGYITQIQLDNFNLCIEQYYVVYGNGIIKNKIAPEVFAMEVREK